MTLHCYKATSSFCTLLLLSIASTTVSAGTTLEAVASNNATTGDYIKTATGCQVYRPPLSYGNRVTWSGDCQSGYAQGKGVAKWYNGKQYTSRYQGIFVDGKLQGKGRIDWEIITNCDFDYYEGELKDSDVMGRGIFHYTDGNIYDGIFTPRGRPAKAVFTWGVGSDYHSDRYEGEFLNGKRQGRGIYTWGEYSQWAGEVYEGEYRNGLHHGFGVYTEPNGTRYEGAWEKNKRSGYGEILQSDGTVYKGQWKDNLMDGYGNIKWSNGAVYNGSVLAGNPHGRGKMIYPSGIIYEGDYEYGERQGRGKITFSDGEWLEVDMKNDAPNGEGVSVRANGIRYAGSFQDGKAWGYGHLTAPRTAYDDDKRAINGVWQDDTFVEKGWFYDNKFRFRCDSTADCMQVAKRDATKRQYLDFLNDAP